MAPSQPFAIRGTNFNMVVLQLRDGTPDVVLPALERLIRQSPAFLRDSPIVLGLDELDAAKGLPDFARLAGLAQLAKGQQLFKSREVTAAETVASAVEAVAAASLPDPSPAPAANPEPGSPAETAGEAVAKGLPALVVTQPIRAGARIFAPGRDIICTATVNPGAELIADGHIHVYGALRGRAIAGASGYEEARIFAHNFDPELVAIAGLYRVREDVNPALIGQHVQVSLHGDEMRLMPFG